jgi:hypothetical protein
VKVEQIRRLIDRLRMSGLSGSTVSSVVTELSAPSGTASAEDSSCETPAVTWTATCRVQLGRANPSTSTGPTSMR